jgi:hypothetical protein
MARPDIQPIVGAMAQAIVMQERWAAGCLYLHDTGDDEAAREAMAESDLWRDRADAIEGFMRQTHTDPGG